MADLKVGTTVGGQLVWTQGNFPLFPTGNSLLYRDFTIYSTNDKPKAEDNDFVSKSQGGSYEKAIIIKNSSGASSYLQVQGLAPGISLSQVNGAGALNGNSYQIFSSVDNLKFVGTSNAKGTVELFSWNNTSSTFEIRGSSRLQVAGSKYYDTDGNIMYGPQNKPTASDVGALALSGGVLTNQLSTNANNFVTSYRLSLNVPNKSVFQRFDGGSWYFLVSDSVSGTYNDLKPFSINTSTGYVRMDNGVGIYDGLTVNTGGINVADSAINLTGQNANINADGYVVAKGRLESQDNIILRKDMENSAAYIQFYNTNTSSRAGWIGFGSKLSDDKKISINTDVGDLDSAGINTNAGISAADVRVGSGSFASQYLREAPFYHKFESDSDSEWNPAFKQKYYSTSFPYSGTWALGTLVNGTTRAPEIQLFNLNSGGTSNAWVFYPQNGDFKSGRNVIAQSFNATGSDALRINGSSGDSIIRFDGSSFYFLFSSSPGASWNALRPLTIGITGGVSMNHGLRVTGGITATDGLLYSGATGRMAGDGNVYGSKWGNAWLDAWITNNFASRNNTGQDITLRNGSFNDVYIRSDRDLKRNLTVIDNALDKVNNLTGYVYEKRNSVEDEEYNTIEAGIIAQDLEKILPEAINNVNGIKHISPGSTIALLVNAINELTSRFKLLESKE